MGFPMVKTTVAVIGGTGSMGRGLVMRLASAGKRVVIGSRKREKAERIARDLRALTGGEIHGATNLEAARGAEIIVLSVPFGGVRGILDQIRPALKEGKILVSVVVALEKKNGKITYVPPEAGSSSEEILRLVPKGVRVVSAFQTTSAEKMRSLGKPIKCDIPVCGDDEEAKRKVIELLEEIPGARGVDCGPLANSRLVEPIVALLVELTRRYRVPGVGLKFEGLPERD